MIMLGFESWSELVMETMAHRMFFWRIGHFSVKHRMFFAVGVFLTFENSPTAKMP